MALNIRNEETEALADALARLTGETKTEAVTVALRERLQRAKRSQRRTRLTEELNEVALHCASLPVRDTRSAEDILGYDDRGLPS